MAGVQLQFFQSQFRVYSRYHCILCYFNIFRSSKQSMGLRQGRLRSCLFAAVNCQNQVSYGTSLLVPDFQVQRLANATVNLARTHRRLSSIREKGGNELRHRRLRSNTSIVRKFSKRLNDGRSKSIRTTIQVLIDPRADYESFEQLLYLMHL